MRTGRERTNLASEETGAWAVFAELDWTESRANEQPLREKWLGGAGAVLLGGSSDL